MNVYSALAEGAARSARWELAQKAKILAQTKIGTMAVKLGISDYRRKPDPSIYAADWGVWLVRWNGKEWRRTKRLWANRDFSTALDLCTNECRSRRLERAE